MLYQKSFVYIIAELLKKELDLPGPVSHVIENCFRSYCKVFLFSLIHQYGRSSTKNLQGNVLAHSALKETGKIR